MFARRMRKVLHAVPMALAVSLGASAAGAEETPQYGGSLQIINYYPSLNALSWDPADWAWKVNHDAGTIYEQLFVGDLSKAKRNGGPYSFEADAWIPTDAIKGELAESWELKEDPLRVEIKLRKGVRFPAKEGVMAARDLVAQDVVYSFERIRDSPRASASYDDHLEKIEAIDDHTVVLYFKEFNSQWEYRNGYGYYAQIFPKEVVDKGMADWRNANGSGPFGITEYMQGNSATYKKNPDYWGSTTIGGQSHKLPFLDSFVYRMVKDESTQHSLLRTGKVDILESIRWSAVDELKKNAPDLKWRRSLTYFGYLMALRNDVKPFDDVRVRRAMNMAVNKQEIVDALYEGNAEILAFPMHPDFVGYYKPLEEMPEQVRELYTYNPEKAKALLAEAGYPKGFSFKAQVCACAAAQMELMPLLASYFEQIGVTMTIEPMEYAAFYSAMSSSSHAAGYMMAKGHSNPTAALANSFTHGDPWNAAKWNNEAFETGIKQVFLERDESKRQTMVQELTELTIAEAPYVYLPTPYAYRAWWPWVKNYDGELRAGSVRPGPIYAQIWIDQALKKKMGY